MVSLVNRMNDYKFMPESTLCTIAGETVDNARVVEFIGDELPDTSGVPERRERMH